MGRIQTHAATKSEETSRDRANSQVNVKHILGR